MVEATKQATWWVTDCYTDNSKTGTPLGVTYKDGANQTGTKFVWDDGLKEVFSVAHEKELAVNVKLVKKGNYWNVEDAELMQDKIPAKEDGVVAKAPMSQTEAIEADNKDRGVALSYAKDMFCADKITKEEIKPTANWLLKYIVKGE